MAESLTRPFTIAEYQQMLRHIYTEVNKRYSDHELLLRLIEEISIVMELVRKDKIEDLPQQLALTYSWVNALASRLDIDLQEALWYKYPNVCTYCLRGENCSCVVEHLDILDKEAILRRLRRDRSKEPKLLKEHQELHRSLYGRQNNRILVIQIAAHLAEEAGEISQEFRHKDQEGITNEIVDVISWIFAIANRLKIDIAETFWNQYPYECEKCHKDVCVCENTTPPWREK